MFSRYECQRDDLTGRYITVEPPKWENFVTDNDCVSEWLDGRCDGTREKYGSAVMRFCIDQNIKPGEFLEMDRKKARDLVWNHLEPLSAGSPSVAHNALAAIKSFYRNRDGETLPFDSRRGGKHYFNAKRGKKASKEHAPSKTDPTPSRQCRRLE